MSSKQFDLDLEEMVSEVEVMEYEFIVAPVTLSCEVQGCIRQSKWLVFAGKHDPVGTFMCSRHGRGFDYKQEV